MDLGLYMEVVRRHRLLVAVGVFVTVVLAFLSYVRVSPDGISYRSPEVWSNEATLVLSQPNFPEWRSGTPAETTYRLASLVDLYSTLATSNTVLNALVKRGLIAESNLAAGTIPITASGVRSTTNGAPTPLMKITAQGDSPQAATKLLVGTTNAFLGVLESQQQAANIPPDQRVVVRTLKRTGETTLAQPRSKTTAVVILLAGLALSVAAAFIRENMRRKDGSKAALAIAPSVDPETSTAALDPASTAAAHDPQAGSDEGVRKIHEAQGGRWTPS